MVDPLNAWWAQQLVLCGWAFTPDPLSVAPASAVTRLAALGVADRGELGWHLVESLGVGGTTSDPSRLLATLELVALAGSAGWLSIARARDWAHCLAGEVSARHDDLDAWLVALRRARSAEGWVRGDDGFMEACEALSTLERDGDGITWDHLGEWLAIHDRPLALWPGEGESQVWRLRAGFAPVVELPAQASDWAGLAKWLGDAWQIHDRDDLLRALLWLGAQGDRQGWDLDATRLLEVDAAGRQAWLEQLAGDERSFGRVMLDFIEHGEPLEWAAWDWSRLVDLAWAGACLGWLDDTEAHDFALHGADLLLHRYSDWAAMARACQRGRSLFEGRNLLPAFDTDWRLLLQSPVSPWHRSLQGLIEPLPLERSRQAMRRWRADPRHWVLALSAVREPELAGRQGVSTPVATARREDARQYLAETLELHPDEGIEALTRYWLPAQAHHLNQLAADARHAALPPAETPFGRADADLVAARDALSRGSRHAATIHMAEKYAFYLQMAMDCEGFDAAGLAALADALRGSLCHFYRDARSLLEAWVGWETLLPEEGQPVLVNEIRWHLEDPGSLFHWLDWRTDGWQEPGLRPSLAHFTAMSLVGPLNSPAWSLPHRESERECVSILEWVDGHYGLHGAEELADFLDFLLEAGDRQEYQINYAPYTLNEARLGSEIATMLSGDCNEEERTHLLRLQRVRDNEDSCNDIDMAAWDVAQSVDLAIAARQLGWLDESAFLAVLERAHALAAAHYAGWEEYARGLYAGFSFFMGETPEREVFLASFRQALVAWLSATPALAGPWASLDFPGARPRHWAPMHIDTLPGDTRTWH
ncbi:DUF1266 domain-containing protein [Halomonas urumqiensis]|uniref:DUF1266 domain-containing protein n=1 Tax=Halomonas urumqiensis TaxID=1684789 RepID=A0A2N7UDV8_9GAMM|nr:DUF1266 domain-containing protein [Halomonas urumqiensis]PMR78581.1 hypothetical protein C1H70_17755 [Halomonas urumqiensis]PTB03725.1 DUF1266 domain-containing protein [Halomonas urumqiensis]GHE20054.1 hypothetical protein GCM10017767_05750 [Halomonas urumqiensis]